MEIWVDADACPVAIREILFRAAKRTNVRLTLIANQPIRVPKSSSIRAIQVSAGFDAADNEIVKRCRAGDLVITSDIPLAAEVLDKGAFALSPRAEMFSVNDIRARLTMRDFLDTMRASGVVTGGPPALNQNDRRLFAGHLDALLAKYA
jgi:uncharacterized protein YaiI (UPF0178 family)